MFSVIKMSKAALLVSAVFGSVSYVYGMEKDSHSTTVSYKKISDPALEQELRAHGNREQHFLYRLENSSEEKKQQSFRPLPTPPATPLDFSVRGLANRFNQFEQPATPTKRPCPQQPKSS